MNYILATLYIMLTLASANGAFASADRESCKSSFEYLSLTEHQKALVNDFNQLIETQLAFSEWPAIRRSQGLYTMINANRKTRALTDYLLSNVELFAKNENINLKVLRPKNPDELTRELAQLGNKTSQDDIIWIEPQSFDLPKNQLSSTQLLNYNGTVLGYGPWTAAWDQSLTIVNANQNAFFHKCKATVFFILPPEFHGLFLTTKPDFFSARLGLYNLN